VFGLWLWGGWRVGFGMGWMHAKLTLVFLLVLYHLWLGKLMLDFKHDRNGRSHVFYRWINELPVVVLIGTVTLVIFKPF
jgi:putative membrane protein